MKRLFELGLCYATPGALETLNENNLAYWQFLDRHASGDWGDLSDHDAALNKASLNPDDPGRIMSSYKMPDGSTIWIITEWDRSVTTVLLPDEY